MTKRETERTSPPELAALPADFWNEAEVVVPPPKDRPERPDEADREPGVHELARLLINCDGIMRWANIECATDGLAGIGKFPSDGERLAAAQTLRR